MSIHWTKFNNYVYELQQAKKRHKRDNRIIKIISKMIRTKNLTESKETELTKLLDKAYLDIPRYLGRTTPNENITHF